MFRASGRVGKWGVAGRYYACPSIHQLLQSTRKQNSMLVYIASSSNRRCAPTTLEQLHARCQLPSAPTDTACLPAQGHITQLVIQSLGLGVFHQVVSVGEFLFHVPLGGLCGCCCQLLEFTILRESHHTVCRNGRWGRVRVSLWL